MSGRRRFFPATPVQQLPGRTVELQVQLRKSGPPALAKDTNGGGSGGGGGDAAVASWLPAVHLQEGYWQDEGVWNDSNNLFFFEGEKPFPEREWETYEVWMPAPPIVSPQHVCTRIELGETLGWEVFYGVVLGGDADVQWELAWDDAWSTENAEFLPMVDPADARMVTSAEGHQACVMGTMVVVMKAWQRSGGVTTHTDTLTATARSGGTVLGVLTLTIAMQGW